MKNKVLLALSGGVDSSVSAFILKQQGYQIIGVTFRNTFPYCYRNYSLQRGINDATVLANRLKFPYFIVDINVEFENIVIRNFIDSYTTGITPNPCVLCNDKIKWTKLMHLADEFNCDFIATGHYADINRIDGRYFISCPKDIQKDQSYFLWRLNQEQLKKTIFPLANYSKKEVKQMAEINGFTNLAQKRESYNICFIPDGNYRHFVENKLAQKEIQNSRGDFVLLNGDIIGEYQGIWNYTVGQKSGLFLNSDEPLYVMSMDALEKKIYLGKKEDLFTKIAILENFNLTKFKTLPDNLQLKARYSHGGLKINCVVELKNRQLVVRFDDPILALSPGQSIALYQENDLIGGGIIHKAILS